jgi:hypothetical protein
MKRVGQVTAILALMVLAAGMLIPMGCEDDPETTDLDAWFAAHPFVSDPRSGNYEQLLVVEPDKVTVTHIGQEITFYAQGGPSSYSWDVAIPGNGTITPSAQSDSATYRATQIAPNTVIVYDSRGHAGLAEISAGTAGTLEIVPDSVTVTVPAITDTNGVVIGYDWAALTTADNLIFNVVGGTRPYLEWANSNPNIGEIASEASDKSSIEYHLTGGGTGDDTILVRDSAGHTETATVTVELEQ